MKLKDQHIFVTGGADGIGRAVVQDVADAGAKVSFCDLNVEKGKAYEAELKADGHRAHFVPGNVWGLLGLWCDPPCIRQWTGSGALVESA